MEQHWNNLFEWNFADLGYVFANFLCDWKHIIFSSTVFVISVLVLFLIRKQSSEGALWRGYFWWTPRKTFLFSIWTKNHIVWAPCHFCRGVEPPARFSKKGDLTGRQLLEGGCWEKRGVTFFRRGYNCHIKKWIKIWNI